MELTENCIEWVTGDDVATLTLSQRKYVNRIRRMAEKHPLSVKILAENRDGSICATIPLSAVHLTIHSPKTPHFKGLAH